jgi:hypothetical protein
MESKELRIGNYYKDGIGREWKMTLEDMIYQLLDNRYKSLYPIPITEEWLIDFGFSESLPYGGNNGYWYKIWHYDFTNADIEFNIYDDFDLTPETGRFGLMNYKCVSIDIKYVHQLQNLYFSLTGQEITKKDA